MASSSSLEKKNVGGKPTRNPLLPIKTERKFNYPSILARGMGYTAAAPLERLEILRQVQSCSMINYMGTIQGLKYIHRTEGFRGLFKGNGTNCMRIVTYTALKVHSYEQASRGILWLYRQQSGNENAKLTPLSRFGAISCAMIIALSATYPLDMVRGRLTIQTEKSPYYKYRGMFHALSTVAREEGPRALYKGYLPSALGSVVFLGVQAVLYESLYQRLISAAATRVMMAKEFELESKLRAKQIQSVKDYKYTTQELQLIKGAALRLDQRLAWVHAFAATIAHTVAYPFDVIHRRMQMVGWKNASSIVTSGGRNKETLEYTGMVNAFRKTVWNEGLGALYKGWVASLVKRGPLVVVAFVTHKVLKNVLEVEVNIKINAIEKP